MNTPMLSLRALPIGSTPHTDPAEAVRKVLAYFPDLPAWPQLPQRSFRENMLVQVSEGFPGVVVDAEEQKIYVDTRRDLTEGLERLYRAYLEGDLDFAAMSEGYAAGFHRFLQEVAALPQPPLAVKGQMVGPVCWGMMVTDLRGRPILYDEVLADALVKHLAMKAAWQERELRKVCPDVVLFLDDPYVAAVGSAYVALRREQVRALLEEVLSAIRGIKGVHCCANADWSLLLESSVDVLSLDAYGYAESLALYPEEVHAFLERGGKIAWGIVPTSKEAWKETAESLVERLHTAMGLLVRKGVPFEKIVAASLITPSCGTGMLSPDLAERIFSLTAEVSSEMRRRYGG
ncbi:MAG: methionine synthase [Anaerolineae bacterium]|nr:methionine synthase [Anaerolineae bacterium]MCX8067210.1 methionine synthase [Anaerolineae bacterium]MDW7990812.1 methionine synthase [Anaerolineae bacterium]